MKASIQCYIFSIYSPFKKSSKWTFTAPKKLMGGETHIGVHLDLYKSSKKALKWAIENLVDNGDVLAIIHVLSHHPRTAMPKSGCPLIPLTEYREPDLMKKYGIDTDMEVLDMLDTISRQKKVIIVAKIYWGDVRKQLCKAVKDLKLDSIVLGIKPISCLERIFLGSETSYIISNASCNVTTVKI